MKTFIFLCLTTAFSFTPTNVLSQNSKIKIDVDKTLTVDEVFDLIMQQTDYKFIYQEGIFDDFPALKVKKGTIATNRLLNRSLSKGSYNVTITDNNTVVVEEVTNAIQQQVSGTIKDNTGQPLPGANVLEKGTTNGVQTDFDGNFVLTVSGDAILEISYLGFVTKEVAVNNQNNIDIVLDEDIASLDEVVVVGYGTAKRKNITGAVEHINVEDSPIALTSNTNVLQAVRGATPGVNIGTQNNVGETPSILVRGTNSLGGAGNNNPLIVLDGVIFLGSVADINPNDIASIDVLKDASTAAVYGSRAANGVIAINTKKGKTGKPVIRFSSTTGINSWQDKPDLLNRDQYLEKYRVQQNFDTVDGIVWEEQYRDVLQDEGVDTDWIDLISRTGVVQRYNTSVSGASDKINYFFSGSYEDQEGVIIGDQFDRVSVNTRLQADVTDWLEVGLGATYTNSDFSGQVANLNIAQRMAPIGYPYRYDEQPFNTASNTSTDLERYPTGNNVQNPLWGTDGTRLNSDLRNFFRMALNAKVKIPWVEGLSYSFNYATDVRYRKVDIFESENYHIQQQSVAPYFDRYSSSALQQNLAQVEGSSRSEKDFNYVVDNILNYNRTFGKHNLDLTFVATRDSRTTEDDLIEGNNFSSVGNTALGIDGLQFAENVFYQKDIVERTNIGYLGKISYGFDSKYNIDAAIRRDGASVFGSENKWGTFWSVGGSWTLTQEDFFPETDFLNYLRLNMSYGVNGNQGLGPYGTLSTVTNGVPGNIAYAFGDDPSNNLFGINQNSLGNQTLGWEETTAFNIGIHARLFKNRVSLDADIYFSETNDQIFSRTIPTTTGFTSILASLGQIDNNGIEISLNTQNINKPDFSWSSGITFWRNRNTVASVFGDDNDGDGVEDDSIANNLFIGESLGAIYGFEYIGVVQESDTQYLADNPGTVAGDPMFRDIDGVAGITAEDRKILGFNRPNFRMGFSNTVTYKNFKLYALFQGVFGGNGWYLGSNPRQNSYQNRFDFNDVNNGDFWTPENQSTTNLRPDFNDGRYLGLQSRAFVRLQNVNLSYDFSQDLLNKMNIGISSIQVYAAADNPVIFTDWFGGGDPEEGIAAQSGTLPVMSTYTFGINVSF